MFAERLRTPGPGSLEADKTPEPIFESVRFTQIEAAYAESNGSYTDRLSAASGVTRLVRETISYKSRNHDPFDLTPEAVSATYESNCHGHTILMSEILSHLEVDHIVGYSNNHSYVLLYDQESRRVTMYDTPIEELCGIDITSAITGSVDPGSPDDFGGACFIDGGKIIDLSDFSDKDEARRKHPEYSSKISDGMKRITSMEGGGQSDKTLILRTYTPHQGREVLYSFDNFVRHRLHADAAGAYEWLKHLDGTYPEIDKRNELDGPAWLVRELGRRAMYDEAVSAVRIVGNSVGITGNEKMMLWAPRHLYGIGVEMHDKRVVGEAINVYEAIRARRVKLGQAAMLTTAKMKKARRTLERMAGD